MAARTISALAGGFTGELLGPRAFLADEGQEPRPVGLKRAHDPDTALRLNENIDPRGRDSAA